MPGRASCLLWKHTKAPGYEADKSAKKTHNASKDDLQLYWHCFYLIIHHESKATIIIRL
jgi:hypothetical protein